MQLNRIGPAKKPLKKREASSVVGVVASANPQEDNASPNESSRIMHRRPQRSEKGASRNAEIVEAAGPIAISRPPFSIGNPVLLAISTVSGIRIMC